MWTVIVKNEKTGEVSRKIAGLTFEQAVEQKQLWAGSVRKPWVITIE